MRIPKHLELFLIACTFMACGIGESRAEITILEKEVVSREIVISVASGTEGIQQVASRECSVLMHNGSIDETLRSVSREISVVVTDVAVPAAVVELEVDVSPTGETAWLDWSNYNELLQGDVVGYRVYISDAPFTDVSGMAVYTNLPAGVDLLEIGGLTAWQDHYFSVVAVDELGGFDPVVTFAAAYVLSPEIVSREFSISVGSALVEKERDAVSRNITMVVSTTNPPDAITDFLVDVSPTGDSATLDWISYNELLQRDIARYDIYYSSSPFTNVSSMTPYTTVQAETQSILLSGLTPWTDHYFAIVPVDVLEGQVSEVVYGAAYVLAPEVVSREFSLFVGDVQEPNRDTISRELTMVVSDGTVPESVTGINGTFSATMSTNNFQSVDLDWTTYNELLQRDVARYRIYVNPTYFEDVSGMEPFAYAPADSKSYTLPGFDAFGIYYIAVVAEDSEGNFDPAVRSASAQASTSGVGDVGNLQVVCGETSLAFSWDPPTDAGVFLDYYNIYFAGATEPETLPSDATGYVVTNLTQAHGYPFRITTVDVFDFESSGVSRLAATLLDNPAHVEAVGQDQQVELMWDAVEPIELVQYYAIYQNDIAFSSLDGMVPIGTTTDTSMTIGGLNNFSTYWFAVVAVNVADGFRTNVESAMATPEPDVIGPWVVAFSPDDPFRVDDENVEQLFNGFTVEFNEEIEAPTFSINDVVVSNSTGAIEVLSALPVSGTQFHVVLNGSYIAGSNTVMIGTNILDLAGNRAVPFETVVMLSSPALPPGNGDGLLGMYYNGQAFTGSSYPRIDGPIAFDWHANSPMPEIGLNYFSSRWTGQIEPRFDGDYVFTLSADDGVRMWLDGLLIIDDWTAGGGETVSTNITLTNDQRYDIKVEYFENTGDANINLQWKFETLPSETIPKSQLYTGLASSEFVARPVMTSPAGVYYGITDVSLSSETENAEIYYSLVDTEPYGDWMLYDGTAIRLISNAVIRAIAVKAGMNDSGVQVSDYDISLVPVPDYDWWKTINFLGITDEATNGKNADPDFDDLPNIVEYAFCLNPNSDADPRALSFDEGYTINNWVVQFSMPTGQTNGGFCWSPNLFTWENVLLEETNTVWFAQSNRCEVVSQDADELIVDTLLNTESPIFFRFDCPEPLAVTSRTDMVVYPEDRKQEWYATFFLRAEDPTIEQYIELREDSGDWLPPATFSYSNNLWTVDQPDWSIISQSEELYTEWELRVKLPIWPANSPILLHMGVRDYSE